MLGGFYRKFYKLSTLADQKKVMWRYARKVQKPSLGNIAKVLERLAVLKKQGAVLKKQGAVLGSVGSMQEGFQKYKERLLQKPEATEKKLARVVDSRKSSLRKKLGSSHQKIAARKQILRKQVAATIRRRHNVAGVVVRRSSRPGRLGLFAPIRRKVIKNLPLVGLPEEWVQ